MERAFSSDTAGVSVAWKWGAAVYTTFTTDYNGLGVKPTHTATCVYNDSDHAGTPQGVDTASGEPYKSFVTGGARGGGRSNWTGSWSGTQGVSVCVKTQGTVSLTIQKEFNDGISVSPDLLGWGMNVTDPFGVTTHYVTDAQSGHVSLSQLPVGTYTVAEDPSGPVPPGCIGPLFNPFQAFLNGVAQTPGPITFTVKSADPVTVLFINLIGCGG